MRFVPLGLVVLLGVGAAPTATPVSPAEARTVAKEAYLYAFAMLENYQTLYHQAVDTRAAEYVGGFGKYRHYSEPFTPANHDIVTPNNDTPYSWAWLDLRAEPWVLSVPAVPKDRYYVIQWIDLFTQNFAYVGVRATGFGAGSYLLAGPKWHGAKPKGITSVLQSETDIVCTLTRTAFASPGDVESVKALQAQYKLEPLSAFLGTPAPPPAVALSFPVYDKAKARTHDFILYLNFLLQLAEPPYPGDVAVRKRMERIGIGPGWPWDASQVDPSLLAAIDAGVKDGQAAIEAKLSKTFDSNHLFGARALLKTDYLTRDVAAAKGLYGNSMEEAWYGGIIGDGAHASVLHFARGKLPPANFFWSLTLYTLPDRFLYANALDRYSVGDRTRGLHYETDGSLTLYLSHASPGKERESNWLPTPEGKYSLVTRVYGPKAALRNGNWKPPSLTPLADAAPAK